MSVNRKRCGLCQADNREELEASLESGTTTCDELDTIYNWRSGTTAQHQRNHMGDYKASSNPRCVLCTDPMRKHYEVAIKEGNITSEAVSLALDTTKEQVQRHIKHHLTPIVQQSAALMLAKKEVNEVDLLSNNVAKLDHRLEQVFNELGNDLDKCRLFKKCLHRTILRFGSTLNLKCRRNYNELERYIEVARH